MKYVISIENEPKLLAQIAEALFLSDPTLIIRNFNNIDGFENWLKSFKENGASALNHAGYTLDEALDSPILTRQLDEVRKKNEAHSIKLLGKELPEHLVLFLVKLEMIQKEQIQKLNECMKTFQELSVCTEEAPTSILFTAFESPTFKAKDFTFSHIGNIIFKPFDKPILNQQIFYALNGHQPAKSEYVFQQKTKATVEMIKEGEIEGFSEVGLVTLNDKKIEPGSFSKLYSKTIETEKLKSTSSVCVFSESNPTDPTQTLCYFKFFALKNEQILALRKHIKESKVLKLKNFKKPPLIDKMGRFFHGAVICPDDSAGPLEEALIRNFKMLKVTRFKESLDLMKLLKLEPTAFDSLIFVNSFFVDDPEKQTNSIKEMISQYNPLYEGAKAQLFPVFIISPHIYPKETEKEFSKFVTNIFYHPLDRAYFLKQFYLELNFLLFKEMPIELQYVPSQSPLKIGYAVETIDLSEAAINFHSTKMLQIGSFRKFILTSENEIDLMEILGKCHYIKENKEKETYEHQFNFFALNDAYLKAIRLWIRNTYIQSKEGSSKS